MKMGLQVMQLIRLGKGAKKSQEKDGLLKI